MTDAYTHLLALLLWSNLRAVALLALVHIALRGLGLRAAAARHAAWFGGLAGCLGLPVASALLPALRLPLLPATHSGGPLPAAAAAGVDAGAAAAAPGMLATLLVLAPAAWAQGANPEWDRIVAAANEEGALIMSSQPNKQARDYIHSEWAKAYPKISLSLSVVPAGQLIARIRTERDWESVELVTTWELVAGSDRLHAVTRMRNAGATPHAARRASRRTAPAHRRAARAHRTVPARSHQKLR